MPPARAQRSSPARSGGTQRGQTRHVHVSVRAPRLLVRRSSHVRIRWERVGRIGLLLVLAIVIGLYAEHARSYLRTRAQADRQQAIVAGLQRQYARLTREQRSLTDPAKIIADARRLGMIRPGELSYSITGTPSR